MNEIYSYLFIGIVVIGSCLAVISALGILRLPDVYTRSHAASKTSTLAVSFVLIGTFLYFWVVKGHFNSRILLAVIFIFMTAPVAGHLISRAAYNTGVKLSKMTVRDDMKKAKQASENKE